MKGIYKFYMDCGRMGFLDGVFVADSKDIEKIHGEEVYFGEVLGKHSDVSSTVTAVNFELVATDQKFIELFEEYDLDTGYNPFDYWEESEEEEEE